MGTSTQVISLTPAKRVLFSGMCACSMILAACNNEISNTQGSEERTQDQQVEQTSPPTTDSTHTSVGIEAVPSQGSRDHDLINLSDSELLVILEGRWICTHAEFAPEFREWIDFGSATLVVYDRRIQSNVSSYEPDHLVIVDDTFVGAVITETQNLQHGSWTESLDMAPGWLTKYPNQKPQLRFGAIGSHFVFNVTNSPATGDELTLDGALGSLTFVRVSTEE